MYQSQKIREIAPEMDPLRMGMGWKVEDLSKPQIIYRKYLWKFTSGFRTSESSGGRCGGRGG